MVSSWKDTQKEFRFTRKLEKPIQELTDDELCNLDTDCDILETDVERLRELIVEEMKRRNW